VHIIEMDLSFFNSHASWLLQYHAYHHTPLFYMGYVPGITFILCYVFGPRPRVGVPIVASALTRPHNVCHDLITRGLPRLDIPLISFIIPQERNTHGRLSCWVL
jgi:hypothetical protein